MERTKYTNQAKGSQSLHFSTSTHGCEGWTLNIADEKRLNAFEMKCYRRMLGISCTEHRKNSDILRQLNILPGSLLNMVKTRKLRFFGHLKRHQNPECQILEGKIEGKRRKGRPTRRWEQDIGEWLKMEITEAGRLADDRVKFRKRIGAVTAETAVPNR